MRKKLRIALEAAQAAHSVKKPTPFSIQDSLTFILYSYPSYMYIYIAYFSLLNYNIVYLTLS